MKKVCVEYGQAKNHTNKKYYFNSHEISKSLAEDIKSVGGDVVTERTDEWFWRNWS